MLRYCDRRRVKCRRWKLAWHIGIMEEGRSAFKISTGKPKDRDF
jgi:hypothetical protein